MSHTITDKSKLTTLAVLTDLAGAAAAVQAKLRGSDFANGDKIVDITYVRERNGNDVVVYITFEDQ